MITFIYALAFQPYLLVLALSKVQMAGALIELVLQLDTFPCAPSCMMDPSDALSWPVLSMSALGLAGVSVHVQAGQVCFISGSSCHLVLRSRTGDVCLAFQCLQGCLCTQTVSGGV